MEIKCLYPKPNLCGFLQFCAREGQQIILTTPTPPGNKIYPMLNKSFMHIKVLFKRKFAIDHLK